MMHILYCDKCFRFTMKKECSCSNTTKTLKPAKYSPGKYAEYRRKAKDAILREKGWL